jgi:PAS domain S-box-containing protein
MDQRSFQNLLRRTVALPVTLLVCLAAILVTVSLLLSNSLRWADHAGRVLTSARQMGRYIVQMDTGLRAYNLTGNKALLDSYQDGKDKLPEQIDALLQLTEDNPPQQQLLREIRTASSRWIDWAQQEIARREQGSMSDAESLVGQRLLEDVREKQRAFASAEDALRIARSRHAEALNKTVVGTAILLSVMIAIVLFTVTRRELWALSSSYERHLQAETEQRRQLSESREWFQSTLNSLGEAVISTDSAGAISYINPVAQELTGWDYTDGNGKGFCDVVRLIDERTQSPMEDPIALVTTRKHASTFSNGLLLTSRSGVTYPIELTGAPILDRRGSVLGVVVVFRDITHRRQTEQTLRTSERLTQAGRLSATIAHEIRNPLDTVSNLVYLLQRDNPTPEQAQYLEMAGDEVGRIAQITSQLLTFHRESRSPMAVSLTDVLESVLAVFAPQVRQNHIEVVKRYETDKSVRGFPGELRQVFSNLVGNAVEVIPRGGRLVLHARESSLASDPSRKGIRVTVLDSGSGIPRGVRKNLFAPFYTTKGEKGTGLGLWISRSIVEKHEGTIHFASRVNDGMGRTSGTAFSVFLPFEQKLGLLDVTREEISS